MSRDGELVAHTSTQSVPAAYQPVFGEFAESALLNLLRQWCKQPPQQMRMTFELPSNYVAHVDCCQRIGLFTVDGEPLDVMVIHVRQLATWVHKPNVLHALAVRALRRWYDADFRAVVAYVAPDGLQWRMQLIMQEIESYRDPVRNMMRTRASVSPSQRMRWEMHPARVAAVPFGHWDALHAARASVTMTELKEAFMPIPTTPEEIFRQAYLQGIEAIEVYTQQLHEQYRHVSFVERAEIDQQKMQLNQLAAQWDMAAQVLQHYLATATTPPSGLARVAETREAYTATESRLTIRDDWTHKSIVRLQHRGQMHKVNSWTQAYEVVLQHMLQEFGITVIEKMNAQARERQQHDYFARDSATFRAPKQLQGWYFDTHGNANAMRDKIRKLYLTFGLPDADFAIWVQ